MPNAIPIESLPDPTLVTDAEGRVVAANEAAGTLFGRSPEDLRGRPLEALIEAGRDGSPFAPGTRTGHHEDGRALRLDVRVSGLRTEHGRRLVVVAREAAADVLLREEREERVARQSRLFGRVAHDLTNLFAVVRNYTEFVLDDAPSPSQVRDDLVEVVLASQRGVRLARQLMALAATEPLEPSPLLLNDVVSAAAPGLREAFGDDVALRTSLDPELPRVVMDPAHAERIVQSLARHGADELPGGGTVEISTASAPADRVELVVAGAAADAPERAPRQGRGWGALALATADALVTRAGGSLEVAEQAGGGVAVRVSLPAAAA